MSSQEKHQPEYDSSGKEVNPYIPKFISAVPWYHNKLNDEKSDDYLSHQRSNVADEAKDHSIPQPGSGINDEFEIKGETEIKKVEDYDSKRDRWHGYETQEWDKIAENWDKIKKKKQKTKNASVEEDSDDTDYELELVELGLDLKDIKNNLKEDPLEKTIRDRQDVPAYILNITSSNKIHYDPKSRLTKDPSKGFINDKNQFVKKLTGEAKRLDNLQKFAWEQNRQKEEIKQRQAFEQKLTGKKYSEGSPDEYQVDLNLNMEANPTAMMLQARHQQEQQQASHDQKKSDLVAKYGGGEFLNKSKEFVNVTELIETAEKPVNKDKNGLKRSIYPEDNYFMNHQSIWGSYYSGGQWGYYCCKQTTRNSRCTAN